MFKTLSTLIAGVNARSEDRVRDAFAIELIDQKIREAEAGIKAAKATLASLIQRQRSEERQKQNLDTRIKDMTKRAEQAIENDRDDMATEAAHAIAQMENELAIRRETLARLDQKTVRLRSSIEAGHRGFLVYDEGVLFILNKMRAEGLVPPETIFKFSVFGGYCSAAGAKVIESMGANSMNPISDVSLPILGAIRRAVGLTLDVYIIIVDSFGGMFRAYETPEIARIASPCYFKFEPGTSEGDIYKPWVTEDFHRNLIREKVKLASIVSEIMERHAPGIKASAQRPDDLVLPVVV